MVVPTPMKYVKDAIIFGVTLHQRREGLGVWAHDSPDRVREKHLDGLTIGFSRPQVRLERGLTWNVSPDLHYGV